MATTNTSLATHEQPWYRRLTLGAYSLGEAARLAGLSPQAVSRWRALTGVGKEWPLGSRRVVLSWLELIELAIAGALYHSGLSLREAASLRERARHSLNEPHPFATERFALDGPALLSAAAVSKGRDASGSALMIQSDGQSGWGQRVRALLEVFDYEDGLVQRWHPVSRESAVCLDPRICFGQPMVRGIATWAIKGRWIARERLAFIMSNFDLTEEEVCAALAFEGIAVAA